MIGGDTYMERERGRAASWKATSRTLPELARLAARYVDKDGLERGREYEFCLPGEYAAYSLLPEVRDFALALFAVLDIPWHAGVGRSPSNHLLSSQVQCVNALGQMVTEPHRIIRAFGAVLGTALVHEIEPGRSLTFEYIGSEDVLNEAAGGVRRRGTHCTSVDAAFVHTTVEGLRELVLVEWKYTEHYSRRRPEPKRDQVRFERYGALINAADGPIAAGLVPWEELLQEPLYQLMRQQLLAHELEKRAAHGAERVRVVHVLPSGNDAYQRSLYGEHALSLGATVKEVWSRLLRHNDRFVQVDSAMFVDPEVTSPEYVARYGDPSYSE